MTFDFIFRYSSDLYLVAVSNLIADLVATSVFRIGLKQYYKLKAMLPAFNPTP
jgi:hypothetical protein